MSAPERGPGRRCRSGIAVGQFLDLATVSRFSSGHDRRRLPRRSLAARAGPSFGEHTAHDAATSTSTKATP